MLNNKNTMVKDDIFRVFEKEMVWPLSPIKITKPKYRKRSNIPILVVKSNKLSNGNNIPIKILKSNNPYKYSSKSPTITDCHKIRIRIKMKRWFKLYNQIKIILVEIIEHHTILNINININTIQLSII